MCAALLSKCCVAAVQVQWELPPGCLAPDCTKCCMPACPVLLLPQADVTGQRQACGHSKLHWMQSAAPYMQHEWVCRPLG